MHNYYYSLLLMLLLRLFAIYFHGMSIAGRTEGWTEDWAGGIRWDGHIGIWLCSLEGVMYSLRGAKTCFFCLFAFTAWDNALLLMFF